MDRTDEVKPAPSKAPGIQVKAKGGNKNQIASLGGQSGKAMPKLGSSGNLGEDLSGASELERITKEFGGQKGTKAKPGDPPAPNLPTPATEPVKVKGSITGPKGHGSQDKANKVAKDVADGQVKKGAGEREKKGGTGKPVAAGSKGGEKAQQATKAAAVAKGNSAASKAEKAKAGDASQKTDIVQAQKGSAVPGKEAPGKGLSVDGRGKDASKSAAAAKGPDSAKAEDKGGKKPESKEAAKEKVVDKKQEKDPATKAVEATKTAGKSPDTKVREAVEQVTGQDLGGVQVHDGSQAQAAAGELGAEAFTMGQDIAMGIGAGKETLAHELAHAAQNQSAGGAAKPAGSISKPGDSGELEADAISQKALGGEAGNMAPSEAAAPVARMAKPDAEIQKKIAPEGETETEQAAPPKTFHVRVGGTTTTVTIPADKQNGKHEDTYPTDIPGLSNAKMTLNIKEGDVLGGELTGTLAGDLFGGAPVKFVIDSNGSVSGDSQVDYNLANFAKGKLTASLNGGQLAGSGTLSAGDLQLPSYVSVDSFEGIINYSGSSVTASGTGLVSLANGALNGQVQLAYSDNCPSGQISCEMLIDALVTQGIKPQMVLQYDGSKITGEATLPYGSEVIGAKLNSSVQVYFNDGVFSGGGEGGFTIDDFISGTMQVAVAQDGKISGKMESTTDTFSLGVINCSGITLTGGFDDGKVNADIKGNLASEGIGEGSFSAGLKGDQGFFWNGSLNLAVPHLKATTFALSHEAAAGFAGEASLSSDVQGMDGTITARYANRVWSGDGQFSFAQGPIEGAAIGVQLTPDGRVSGDTTLDLTSINLPNAVFSDNQIKASFGEQFSIGGSAHVKLSEHLAGTLSMTYTNGAPFQAGIVASVQIAGLEPVDLNLELAGKSFAGQARTKVNIPYTNGAEVEVGYRNGVFHGGGSISLSLPYLKEIAANVSVTSDGQLAGGLQITGQDFNISPLTLENPSISGRIANGKISLDGSSNVKGIPGCELATLKVGMDEDQKFHGGIEAKLKIPGLKEASVSLYMRDGSIKGRATLGAEIAGFSGTVVADYNDGAWSGTGTLGFNKGKFNGAVQVNLSEAAKLSGQGRITYALTNQFQIEADATLREDASMEIGGRIRAPSRVDLAKKDYRKSLVNFNARIGIPGLSLQLPIVGVIGPEIQLGGGADIFANVSLFLTNITVGGSFDTATNNVNLQVGGTLQSQARAGVGLNLEGAVGLGVGPAFVGGYLSARGEAAVEASAGSSVMANYNSGSQDLTFDVGLNASAGLLASLTVDMGLKASVKVGFANWERRWSFGPLARWSYNLGRSMNYNPSFKYTMGKELSDSALAPKRMFVSGMDLAKKAGSALAKRKPPASR